MLRQNTLISKIIMSIPAAKFFGFSKLHLSLHSNNSINYGVYGAHQHVIMSIPAAKFFGFSKLHLSLSVRATR
jgi:hypothetical protein